MSPPITSYKLQVTSDKSIFPRDRTLRRQESFPVPRDNLLDRPAHIARFRLAHVGVKRQGNQFRVKRGGLGQILRSISEGLAVIRMHVQWHPMNRRPDPLLLQFGNELSAIDPESIQLQADGVEVPRMNAVRQGAGK